MTDKKQYEESVEKVPVNKEQAEKPARKKFRIRLKHIITALIVLVAAALLAK